MNQVLLHPYKGTTFGSVFWSEKLDN